MQESKMEKCKEVNIKLNLGVGFYTCELSVRIYESTGTAGIIDRNAKTGCAVIKLDRNPAWSALLCNADDNESITIDGSVYDQTYAEVEDLTVRVNLSSNETKFYSKGIIMPRAYDYNWKLTFREGYFGASVAKPQCVYCPPKIIRTLQVNEYQVYQNGHTYTVRHDNFKAWEDGRLRIEVVGVMSIDLTIDNSDSERIYNDLAYAEFCKVKDPTKIPDEENYIIRLIYALIDGWQNHEDAEKAVNDEFSI